jgi:signal transduction histidine kinase/CheY-like chemotaxis protein
MAAGASRQMMRTVWLLAMGCLLLWLLLWLVSLPTQAESASPVPATLHAPAVQIPVNSSLSFKSHLLMHRINSPGDDLQDVVDHIDDPTYWFSLATADMQALRRGQHPLWMQLRIHNRSDSTQYLWLDQPSAYVAYFSVLVLRQNQVLHQYEAGTTVPMSRWPSNTRTMLFPLQVEAGDTLTILMRNEMTSLMFLNDFTLWQRDAYTTRFDVLTTFHWMYTGSIWLMILYNLMLFIFTRDRSYIYYTILAGTCWASFFTIYGYDRWLFWPEATSWNSQSFHFFHSLQFIAAILFAQNFLGIRQKSPRGFVLLNVLAALVVLLYVAQMLGPNSLENLFAGVRFAITLPILLSLWVIPLRLMLRGDHVARLYFIAASVYLLAWALATLWILGIMEAIPLLRDSVLVGQTIELLVLSIALANRINELKQRERAAHLAMEAKSTFLASMSHEIRTPMNGVVSMSDLLMTMKLPAAARQCVSIINSSTLSLISVINEILDYSKLEAGKLSLHEEMCDPVLAIRDAVILFEAQAAEKRLALTAVVDHDVPQLMRLDITRLRQILMNLISNAIKFTIRGSINVHVSRTERQLVIDVSDTGIGMTPEQGGRLFRVYQQAGADIAGRFGGTGLGLAICKQLAELMNGDIEVDSSPQRGSTFTLRIPMREAQLRPLQISSQHVCVLSDDAHYVNVLRQWFERQKIGFDAFDDVRPFRTWCASHDHTRLLMLIDSTLALPMLSAFTDVIDIYPPHQIAFLPSIRNAINARADNSDHSRVIASAQHLPRTVVSVHWWNELAAPSAPNVHAQLPHARILVADDDATNRIIIDKLLRELGQDVTLVNDGEQALDVFFSHHFDLLIIDCEMPKLDGINATRRIRALQKGAVKTPIIALTAHTGPEIAAEYLEAGANIILTKPINLARLQSALESTLQNANSQAIAIH